jgi:hypothetical protein
MARRRKRKPRFKAATEARRRARLGAGAPPSERIIPNKRDKPAKHKQTLKDFLERE